ncbi:hypothetical protein AVEN_79885-1 [Araneus ventricosus]|uniref:Uncharacterized protein n=1 Tax=Araneus ventricosus TaxID=182803 RepID=A0A4Y2DSQ2_ARAVE|nr:hypothetical protein AVEN_79885-1 [Araneus ventricosus]
MTSAAVLLFAANIKRDGTLFLMGTLLAGRKPYITKLPEVEYLGDRCGASNAARLTNDSAATHSSTISVVQSSSVPAVHSDINSAEAERIFSEVLQKKNDAWMLTSNVAIMNVLRTVVVEAFVPSVHQSIETGIEEIEEVRVYGAELLKDSFLNFGIGSEMGICQAPIWNYLPSTSRRSRDVFEGSASILSLLAVGSPKAPGRKPVHSTFFLHPEPESYPTIMPSNPKKSPRQAPKLIDHWSRPTIEISSRQESSRRM